jgi:hypothetical protein
VLLLRWVQPNQPFLFATAAFPLSRLHHQQHHVLSFALTRCLFVPPLPRLCMFRPAGKQMMDNSTIPIGVPSFLPPEGAEEEVAHVSAVRKGHGYEEGCMKRVGNTRGQYPGTVWETRLGCMLEWLLAVAAAGGGCPPPSPRTDTHTHTHTHTHTAVPTHVVAPADSWFRCCVCVAGCSASIS